MWNHRKPTRAKTNPDPQSSLNGLMNAVDSYISELNEQQTQQRQQQRQQTSIPNRSHSLQQSSRVPLAAHRANTTHAYPTTTATNTTTSGIYYPDSNTTITTTYNNNIKNNNNNTYSSTNFNGGDNTNNGYFNTVQRNNSAHCRFPTAPGPSLRQSTFSEGGNSTMQMPTPQNYIPTSNSNNNNESFMYPLAGYASTPPTAPPDYVNTYLSSAGRKHEKTESYPSTIISRNSSLFSRKKNNDSRDSSNSIATIESFEGDVSNNKTPSKLPPPINTHQLIPVKSTSTITNGPGSSSSSNSTSFNGGNNSNNMSLATPTTATVPEYACLSILSRVFLIRIRSLENVRELFCANEYPESFTGQEAIKTLYTILDSIPEAYCVRIANALMKAVPPVFSPIHYSQKSIIQGTVYNSPDEYYTITEDMTEKDVPVGIFTTLLDCYSYDCQPGKGGCYAPKCPNKPQVFSVEFENCTEDEEKSSRPQSEQSIARNVHSQMAWAQRVSQKLLESIPKKERERQEAINEMIYSEVGYNKDLETLLEVIVEPLLRKNIMSPKKKKGFITEVFGNYKELIDVSSALMNDLLNLQQRYEHECVPMIGDVLIRHFAYFEDPFSKYCPHVSLSEYLVKEEEHNNSEFAKFIVHVEKNKRMRRLAFRHFLLVPVTRLQRYPLLLEAIIKKTDKEHKDYTYLVKCQEMVKAVATKSDNLAEMFKQRVEILEINDNISFKQNEATDLQLTDPQRKLYYVGDMKRRNTGSVDVPDKSDIHIFIFDHMLLLTKIRKTSTNDEYRVWKRPIPLQMLHISSSTTNTGLLNSNSTSSSSVSGSNAELFNPMTSASSRGIITAATTSTSAYLHGSSLLVPVTLHHLGLKGGVYSLFCTPSEKQKLKTAIDDAKTTLKKKLGNDVYDITVLDDTSFKYVNSSIGGGARQATRVSCTAPFDKKEKLAIGTDTGVYFKTIGSNSIEHVLNVVNVTQIHVLEEHHILLVLADKTLKAYPMGLLKPSLDTKAQTRLGQELGQHINFFQVGICSGKLLVVYKKKKNTSSIFTALEPLYDLSDPKNQKYIAQTRTFMLGHRSNQSWFKKYKEFYIGTEASNLHFLKSKLLIVCDRGFEIIDPENLSVGGRDIPDKGDPQFNFLDRQTESIKPLAMYRVHDKFLLCYTKFAFYINNRNGSLVQRGPQKLPIVCDWEGHPDNIVFQYPYVIVFDPQFLEIRHVETGALSQIIAGDQIRLTYYQSNGDTAIIQGCMTHSKRSDLQIIFSLTLSPRNNSNPRKYY